MALTSIEINLVNSKHTQELGRLLGQFLEAGSVIFLEGDLGAGKTTLVQGIGHGLGIEEAIVSPTFTLINEYLEGVFPLYHLDLYRLESTDIVNLSPEIYWEGREVIPGITAIEWAQRLPYLPQNRLEIQLTCTKEEGREAKLVVIGDVNLDLSLLKLELISLS